MPAPGTSSVAQSMPRADGENESTARAAMEASGHLRGDKQAQVCTAECGEVVDGLSMVVWQWKRSLPILRKRPPNFTRNFSDRNVAAPIVTARRSARGHWSG